MYKESLASLSMKPAFEARGLSASGFIFAYILLTSGHLLLAHKESSQSFSPRK